MLYIKKSQPSKEAVNEINRVRREQKALLEKRDHQIARKAFDCLDKSLIRECLIKEQHGLCGYCMRRIENDATTTIEHWEPIERNVDGVLDYGNMLGVCDGGSKVKEADIEDGRRILCCDAAKGNQEITISPYNKDHMDKIRYHEDGTIYTHPRDEILERDINDVLHLNGENGLDTSTRLLHGRRETYRSYFNEMKRHGNKISRAYIEKRIKAIKSKDEYPAFAGVILYLLKRKLREFE